MCTRYDKDFSLEELQLFDEIGMKTAAKQLGVIGFRRASGGSGITDFYEGARPDNSLFVIGAFCLTVDQF